MTASESAPRVKRTSPPSHIFVVGLPRTGTKLMKSILESAQFGPVRLSPETWFFGDLFRGGVRNRIRRMGDMSDDRNVYKLVNHLYATDINRTFWNQVRSKELDISKQLMLERFLKSDRSERSLYDALMKTTAEVRLGYQADKHIVVGDKMPGNLYYVPTLISWFPDAKVIHMFRDPRAILASERKRLMDKHGSELMWRRIRPIYSIVVVLYVTLTWLYAIRLHRIYSARYPDNYCLCKYEDLIENPKANIKRLCEDLGIGFDNRMLTPERKDSSFGHTGRTGFDETAVHHWKLQLKPWMKIWLSVCGGRGMKQFGYVP